MTIAGVNVIDFRRTLIWCDSEVYRDGAPAGIANKMAANVLTGTVGVGTGSMLMLHEAAATIQRAASLDESVDYLPAALRTASQAFADTPAARAIAGLGQYAVTGRSDRFGRVVAYAFRARDNFRPELVSAWSHPACTDALAVMDVHSAIAAALRQMDTFRAEVPGATGGRLVVAEFDGAAITARALDAFKSAPPVEGPAGAVAGGVGECTHPAGAHTGAMPHGI